MVKHDRPDGSEVAVARSWLRGRHPRATPWLAALPLAALSCHDEAIEHHGAEACDASHSCRSPYVCVDGRCTAPTAGAGGDSTETAGGSGEAGGEPSGAAGVAGIAGTIAMSGAASTGGSSAAGAVGAAGVPAGPGNAGEGGAASASVAGAAGSGAASTAGNAGAVNGPGAAGQGGVAGSAGAATSGGTTWVAGFAGTTVVAGAAGAGGMAGAGGAEPEICNFHDDDGDGEVDEGFDWVLGPWRDLISTNDYAVYPEALTLADGRVALSVSDSAGAGNDRGGVAVLSAEGEILLEPVWTDIPNAGVDYTSVAEGPGGEVAAIFSSADYAGCASGCPVTLARFDGSDLRRISTDTLSLPFLSTQAYDLVRTPNGYVTVVKDTGDVLHVTWLDDGSREFTVDRPLAGSPSRATSLALGPAGLAWWRTRVDSPRDAVDFGILVADGSGVVLTETEILSGGGFRVAGDGNIPSLVAVDNDFVASYFDAMVTDQPPRLIRLDRTGSMVAGPIAAGAPDSLVRDLALVDDNIAVLAASIDAPTTATLRRFRADLAPVAGSSASDLAFSIEGDLTMVRTSAGLVLVDGVAYSKRFRSALVHCP